MLTVHDAEAAGREYVIIGKFQSPASRAPLALFILNYSESSILQHPPFIKYLCTFFDLSLQAEIAGTSIWVVNPLKFKYHVWTLGSIYLVMILLPPRV
jgi:hypothetical protein